MSKDFGGRMTVRLSNGKLISLRGTFNVQSSKYSIEAVTNQDGSLDRNATPVPARVDIAIVDKDVTVDELMTGARLNMTIAEEFSGVTHYLTQGFFTGDPQSNRMTGEITGLGFSSEKYTRTPS